MADNGAVESLACPNREELAAFARGQLPDDQLDSLLQHLSACRFCASSVEELFADDTLLRRLRGNPSHWTVAAEPLCCQLEERARIIPQQQSRATVSDSNAASVHEGPPLPAVFGAYVLLEKLDQGGMGVVYKARQESLKRSVALKLVRAGVYANTEERTRFQREGEVIARIRHPHVVQIHEFGEHQGQLFFSMELLEGGTLAQKLNGQPLPERAAAELLRTLARTVQVAHAQGIVHRDLKPGNVLFAADGTVKITDFGLAKVLDAEGGGTITDAILGTPAYMAPEQARGESRHIGPAADVYALGVILYETLTGQPPFHGQSRFQTLELVRTREPQPPSRRRAGLSRDLEAICLKCLEKEPSQRYPSAQALADDLDHWLRDEPLAFRPRRGWRRALRLLRRHRRWAAAAALLLGLALSIAAILWHRHPERTIQAIEARLARGQEQTLIGDTGEPAWFRLAVGKRASQTTVQQDGSFTVHSWSLALVELLRDPQLESYRLRAEVRHDNNAMESSDVGIYVAYRGYPVGQQVVHSLLRMTFNDIDDPQVRYAEHAKRWPKRPPITGNPLRLAPMLYVDVGKPAWELNPSGLHKRSVPAGYGRTDWRSMALEVTPTGITAFWEGKELGHLSAENLVQNIQFSFDSVRRNNPQDPFVDGISADYSPRGGVGLFIQTGSGSFRHVVIEPLPHPQEPR